MRLTDYRIIWNETTAPTAFLYDGHWYDLHKLMASLESTGILAEVEVVE